MTEPEARLRAYASSVARSQRPVEIDEVVTHRRHKRVPLARIAGALIGVAVIAGTAIVVARGHAGSSKLVVAPATSSSASAGSTTPVPANCPAASLVVTGTRGEALHAGWLPPRFVLTEGSETQLGQIGGPTYSAPGGGGPRVELLRYHTSQPLAKLYAGTPSPTVVQGHPGIISVGSPIAQVTALLWNPIPGVALVVNGYELPEADLRKVAENVHYEAGSTFAYPAHPAVNVSRAQAIATLGHEVSDAHAALTSFGEISAVTDASRESDVRVPLEAGISVTEPVWVVWAGDPAPRETTAALVIDATTGDSVVTIPHIGSPALDAVTDRRAPGCVPPFGVLTRTEATFVARPQSGVTTIIKLATLGSITAPGIQCELPSTCDPAVPVWIVIRTASDHRFVDEEFGPPGRTEPTKPGSFSITMIDARTGPQTTNFGGELGPGRPPASLLAIPDLEP